MTIQKTNDEWKKVLTPEQYHVTREQGTEAPFTGAYHDHHAEGTYQCCNCGAPLFPSEKKFDSGTGWPSFAAPTAQGAVGLVPDTSRGMERTEVVCQSCGAHLGHVFDDGPTSTGKRYCINSAALNFNKNTSP